MIVELSDGILAADTPTTSGHPRRLLRLSRYQRKSIAHAPTVRAVPRRLRRYWRSRRGLRALLAVGRVRRWLRQGGDPAARVHRRRCPPLPIPSVTGARAPYGDSSASRGGFPAPIWGRWLGCPAWARAPGAARWRRRHSRGRLPTPAPLSAPVWARSPVFQFELWMGLWDGLDPNPVSVWYKIAIVGGGCDRGFGDVDDGLEITPPSGEAASSRGSGRCSDRTGFRSLWSGRSNKLAGGYALHLHSKRGFPLGTLQSLDFHTRRV